MNDLPPRIDPEFAALIPPLSPEEYRQLEQNILAYKKCRDAIVVWGDIIVDGHNRFRICAEHGITFEIKEMDFDSRDEAMLWILDNQLGRRNLSDAMRIELAISKSHLLREQAKANLTRGGRSKTGEKKPLSEVSNGEGGPINVRKAIAKEAGVSEGTVHGYRQISKYPELHEAVNNGELKIDAAFHLLPQELVKQFKKANKQLHYVEKHLPIAGNDAANKEIHEKLINLLTQLESLKEAQDA